jgi:hypothetical protein
MNKTTVTVYIRFPWIHNKEPFAVQLANVFPSVHHAAVPLW